jgi:predicted outer membrane repeat protein
MKPSSAIITFSRNESPVLGGGGGDNDMGTLWIRPNRSK